MLIRALAVLLLVLNLGVALWWTLRAPAPSPEPAVAAGIARLQLVTETQVDQAVAPQASTPAAEIEVGPSQCFSFGPFVDAAAVEQAQLRLQSQLMGAKARRAFTGTPNQWQVLLPPLPSKDEAQRAANLAAAGFPARVVPLGAGPAEYWLDAAAGAEFDPAGAQALIAANRAEPIDCAGLDGDHPASPPTASQPTP